ncbi:HAD family hydrolase [Streptomyces pseudoechinosporeus]
MTTKKPASGEPDEPGQQEALRRLLDDGGAVLVDFDGTICDLFGTTPTAPIAKEVKDMARGEWGVLDQAVEDCDDSHGILLALRTMYDRMSPVTLSRRPLKEAHRIVTRHEYAAVASAKAAPDLEPLLNALTALGKRLVVVSNNAEGPVWEYLKHKQLQSKFVDVCGRDPHEPRHMKPHPDSLCRALKCLKGVTPSHVLMVGDQLTDLVAARAAGVRFLGYTHDAGDETRRRGLGGHFAHPGRHRRPATGSRSLRRVGPRVSMQRPGSGP